MIRLALLAATTCLLSCTLPDQTEPETSSVDQNSTSPIVCDGKPYVPPTTASVPPPSVTYTQMPGNTCFVPTPWVQATQSTLGDFWAPGAKVMFSVEMQEVLPPGATYRPSMYVIYGAGAYDGTNTLWKAVEVNGTDIDNYHNIRRALYDSYEAGGVIWDGGSGVPLGGQPGGHIGPHGFPSAISEAFLLLFSSARLNYGSKIQGVISGFHGD